MWNTYFDTLVLYTSGVCVAKCIAHDVTSEIRKIHKEFWDVSLNALIPYMQGVRSFVACEHRNSKMHWGFWGPSHNTLVLYRLSVGSCVAYVHIDWMCFSPSNQCVSLHPIQPCVFERNTCNQCENWSVFERNTSNQCERRTTVPWRNIHIYMIHIYM